MIKTLGLLAVVMVIAFFSCSSDDYANHDEYEETTDVVIPEDVHVFLIGFDGWSSTSFGQADMPFLKEYMHFGCYTLKKKSVLPSSSAPNWASMMMGVGPDVHGYVEWNTQVPVKFYIEDGVVKQFPTIAYLLRSQKPDSEIGFFYQWEGMKYVADTLAMSYICRYPYYQSGVKHSKFNSAIYEYIYEKKPKMCLIFFSDPDATGHRIGFNTQDYIDTLSTCDICISNVIKATKDAGIYDKSVFIVTSDHGGTGTSHGGSTADEMETPFIIWGYHIKNHGELSFQMMQYDIAPTLAYLMGLESPTVWIGRTMKNLFY